MSERLQVGEQIETKVGVITILELIPVNPPAKSRVKVALPSGEESVWNCPCLRRRYLSVPRKFQCQWYEGRIVEVEPYGPVEVLRLYRTPGRMLRADVRFLRTGTVTNVQTGNIKAGKIYDCRHPTVYGHGYIDSYVKIPDRSNKNTYRRAYDLWSAMLKRVYHPSQQRYYGDCSVDPRWHSFRVFWNTIQSLPGYQDWVEEKYPRMALDKDSKYPGNRVYSAETCVFMSSADNAREVAARKKGISFVRKDI